MGEPKLVGYARRSDTGNALKINLSLEYVMDAERYTGKDGQEYIPLTIRAQRVIDILNGDKEVTCVTQFVESE